MGSAFDYIKGMRRAAVTFYLNMKEEILRDFPCSSCGNNNFPARRDRSISCNLTEVDCYYTYWKPGLSTCIRLIMLVSRRTFSFRIFLLLFGEDSRACGTYNMYVINNIRRSRVRRWNRYITHDLHTIRWLYSSSDIILLYTRTRQRIDISTVEL